MDLNHESQAIIDSYGVRIANKVRVALLEEENLAQIKPELEFISKNWYDPLTPGLINLAFNAVGGKSKNIQYIGMALGLVNLSINLWDDIIDDDSSKLFKPTFYGKFGKEKTLIVGGLALSKAYKIINDARFSISKKIAISNLIWNMWTKLGIAEINDCKYPHGITSDERFSKIVGESIYTDTVMRIGAILGSGRQKENEALGCYGHHLGIILETSKDIEVSLNLTAELLERLQTGKLPFSLVWASENSKELRGIIEVISNKQTTKQVDIKNIVSAIIEAGTIGHIVKIIDTSSTQASEALDLLNDTTAKIKLKKFVGAQPQLFRERLQFLSKGF